MKSNFDLLRDKNQPKSIEFKKWLLLDSKYSSLGARKVKLYKEYMLAKADWEIIKEKKSKQWEKFKKKKWVK